MKTLRQYIALLLFSIIGGGVLTTYFEGYQTGLLMPIRNRIVLGTWESHSGDPIPVSRYQYGEGINPVTVAQTVRDTALELLDARSDPVTVGSAEVYRLLAVADFFAETAEERHCGDSAFYVWTYDFDYPPAKMSAPWISGMAQGHVIEVMLAAYKLTGEERYLATARLAANAMAVPIEYGGVAKDLGDGLWFEEYAQPGVPPRYVLNGHNFALSGLYYLSLVDSDYTELFERGLRGLELLLPDFDKQIWSMYDLQGVPASRQYQRIHATQLGELYDRTGQESLSFYARRFRIQLYLPFGAFYRIVTYPHRFLVVLFLGNTLIVLGLGAAGLSAVQRLRNPESRGQDRPQLLVALGERIEAQDQGTIPDS